MRNWREWRDKRNAILQDIREVMYWHIHVNRNGKNWPNWRNTHIVKMPNDLILYAEAIFENKPDFIVETGTRFGGSAMFFADMLGLAGGKGRVITIDVAARAMPVHPGVEYIVGSSSDPAIVEGIKRTINGSNVMVTLDSDHSERHVRRELRLLSPLVTPGQFLVVEDCYSRSEVLHGPGCAKEAFMKDNIDFVEEPRINKYLFGITRGGWLRRQ